MHFRLIPPATETLMYNITTEVNVTQSTGQDLLGEREEKLKGNDWNETESQYNIQLREVAAENLRSIGALRREGKIVFKSFSDSFLL